MNLNSLKYFGRKSGIQRQKKWEYYNAKHGEEIEQMYTSGMFLNEIANHLNLKNYDLISNILKARGVVLRSRCDAKSLADVRYIDTHNGRKYSLNHDYFKTWSSNMAYILGFAYADGNVHDTSFKIALKGTDADLLYQIKKEIEYTADIGYYDAYLKGKSHEVSKLLIRSKVLTDDLKALGVVPNKSLIIEFPDIPKQYESDFLRGYFDGDGSVGQQYPTNSKGIRTKIGQVRVRVCCGSEGFLTTMRDKFFKVYGLRNVKVSKCKKNLYEISYSTKDSITLYEIFYKNNSMCLKRKKEDFEKFINQRNEDIENNK